MRRLVSTTTIPLAWIQIFPSPLVSSSVGSKRENLDFNAIEESQFDDLIGMETGASIIFGNTGGVMEAAMRTAYKLITDKEPPPYALTHLEDVRGMEGVKAATVQLGDDVTLSVAVVHGGKNT